MHDPVVESIVDPELWLRRWVDAERFPAKIQSDQPPGAYEQLPETVAAACGVPWARHGPWLRMTTSHHAQ